MLKCHLICINTVQLPAESMKPQECKWRRTCTHNATFALALTLSRIANDSSIFCSCSEIYIKGVFSRWAAKSAHTQRYSILQREGFFEGKLQEGWGGLIKGQQRKLKVCITLDLCASLQTSLCCYTPLLLFSLYSDTKHEGNLWSVNKSLKNDSPLKYTEKPKYIQETYHSVWLVVMTA